MFYKDFQLISGLVTDLEYNDDDIIDFLSQEQHDAILKILRYEYDEHIEWIWTAEIVDLMRMLILTPSVETICDKWLRLTGNTTLFDICTSLKININFQKWWIYADPSDPVFYRFSYIVFSEGLLFKIKNMKSYKYSDIALLAGNGHLECLKCCSSKLHGMEHQSVYGDSLHKYKWDINVAIMAASNGHLDCLEYVTQHDGYPLTYYVMNVAAKNGHLDCLEYAYKRGFRMYYSDLVASAARNGHLDCLKFLHQQKCPWDEFATEYAAINGHFECLKFLHENGCPWNLGIIINKVIQSGNVEILRYLHENGCPLYENMVSYSAKYGYLECLEYLVEHGVRINENTINSATRHGHLECLKFLHKNGCKLTERAVALAVKYKHYDCLSYLLSVG